MERVKRIIQEGKPQDGQQQKKTYDCNICRDLKVIVEGDLYKECSCVAMKRYKELLKQSEFKGLLDKYDFSTYQPKNVMQRIALQTALKYVEDFENIRTQKNNGVAFLGQSGAGKSHLSTCIGKGLLEKRIPLKYMSYINDIQGLKMAKTKSFDDPEVYLREINKYKSAPVLIVDELFKTKEGEHGKISSADITIMLDIYNYFIATGKPIITNSQRTVNQLREIDEALAGRIIEMSEGRVVEFVGKELNHRFRE
jgi:DNA replication protein DnaC